jgi:OmpA-OmpF porin, OOP family
MRRNQRRREMIRKALFLALILVVTAPAAMAGGYIGASAGQSSTQAKDSDINLDFSGNTTGYKAFLGWNFFKFVGAELSYHKFGTVKDTVSGVEIKSDADSYDVFAVGKIPIGFVEPFAKVGYCHVSSKADIEGNGSASDSNWDVAYGVGVGFNLVKVLHLRVEYEKFEINPEYNGVKPSSELYMISAGAAFRF